MKIIKSQYVQKMLTLLAFFVTIILSILTYVLGWLSEGVELISFLIFLTIMVGEGLFFGLFYFVLQKFNKNYYLIENDAIKLFKNNQEICRFELKHICEIYYIRFFWSLLMQFGAGYLMIHYTGEDNITKPDMKYPDGTKLYGIAMSPKQAREVSETLNRSIPIK